MAIVKPDRDVNGGASDAGEVPFHAGEAHRLAKAQSPTIYIKSFPADARSQTQKVSKKPSQSRRVSKTLTPSRYENFIRLCIRFRVEPTTMLDRMIAHCVTNKEFRP
jgi:hypothetical protein